MLLLRVRAYLQPCIIEIDYNSNPSRTFDIQNISRTKGKFS